MAATNHCEEESYSVIASANLQKDSKEDNKAEREKGDRLESLSRPEKRQKADSMSTGNTLAPLFRRNLQTSQRSSPTAFLWKSPVGPNKSCLIGELGKPFDVVTNATKSGSGRNQVKFACFDLDGCLVRPKHGKTWPSATDVFDYEEVFRGAFARVRQEYESGACICIITNQDQKDPNSRRLATWKLKMANIAQAIDCPMIVLAAIAKDGFRKPGRLMWDHAIVPRIMESGGNDEDIQAWKKTSYFVGDAAGRTGDHSDTDRKWANNVNLRFYTPEEFFLGHEPRDYTLSGWKPKLENDGQDDELSAKLFSSTTDKLDLVLFVGPPASGKSSLFRHFFADRAYERVNQDTLKTAARCLTEARSLLGQGRSVVVDNTNRNVSTRAQYIHLAREFDNVRVRCIFFDVNKEVCWHNNLYRVRAGLQFPDEPRSLLPQVAFSTYFQNLEVPTQAEGFDSDIVVVRWAFRGGEEERRRWLQQWE